MATTTEAAAAAATAAATAAAVAGAKEAVAAAKKELLLSVERKAQQQWETEKAYEADAPAEGEAQPEKFFATFPYPYMNGKLHLGHCFSLTKPEFAARYWRLKGRKVLWPFGLHLTGTPIAACAQKLANEMRDFGNPPVFPEEFLAEKKAGPQKDAIPGKHASNRGKVAGGKPQWQIMQSMGLSDEEIARFASPAHWLEYFPPLALVDLKGLGCHIDYRRSFITTDANPFYNSFIEWQFRQLRARGLLHYGRRYSIYSPLDEQPCADHDRASGEGVPAQEYTVVKMIVQNPTSHAAFAPFASIIGDKTVVLPGATLRAETVVGQTNVWVSPTVTYKAFEIASRIEGKPSQIFIMTEKAARNMAYQDVTVNGGKCYAPTGLFEVPGSQMIGLPVAAPQAPYAVIYCLPMASITEAKGTGVVMSVPSDSPDDYINFIQFVKKEDYRKKLSIKDEWVLPFSVVPIIEIPNHEYGTEAARIACEQLKVGGPGDAAKLEEAKKAVYQAGFYQGQMLCGPFKGEKVAKAKVQMTKMMIESDEAMIYYEPQKPVTSRSGDECVVALCAQWYIEYGKAEWKAAVNEHMKGMELYFPGVRNAFEETLNWLAEWPCSRTFGLGTMLPFADSKGQLIDSLSDSTIYMAYYTAAKHLHAAADGSLNLDGTKPNKYGITPAMMTDDAWEYVLRGVGTAESVNEKTGLPLAVAKEMRAEFAYWYPVDLRTSAKDLIPNHLTMFLYNHAAIWPDDKGMWPKSVFCNGQIVIDGEKMSKSKGNFVSMADSLTQYGADATRLACADAGDSMDDANFVRETASGFIIKLANVIESFTERAAAAAKGQLRTGDLTLFDKIFENAINAKIKKVDHLYQHMQFRSVLCEIFFELAKDESTWRLACGAAGLHGTVARRHMEVFTLLLAPLAPHTSEHLWREVLGNPGSSVVTQRFPEQSAPVDLGLHIADKMIEDLTTDIRTSAQKLNKKRTTPITTVHVYLATQYHDWQKGALGALHGVYVKNNGVFPADTVKQLQAAKESWLTGGNMPEVMAFINFMRGHAEKYGAAALSLTPPMNDMEIVTAALSFVQSHSGIAEVILHNAADASVAEHAKARATVRPGQPGIVFDTEAKK